MSREQCRTRARLQSIVCAEMTTVTTQLRAELRASSAAYRIHPAASKLLRSFTSARSELLAGGPESRSCMVYLEPFLETIRLEETSGIVTERALSAARSFLSANILPLDEASEPAGMAAIVRAATYCRFEVTDPAADEVVLMSILQLLISCVECPSGEISPSPRRQRLNRCFDRWAASSRPMLALSLR